MKSNGKKMSMGKLESRNLRMMDLVKRVLRISPWLKEEIKLNMNFLKDSSKILQVIRKLRYQKVKTILVQMMNGKDRGFLISMKTLRKFKVEVLTTKVIGKKNGFRKIT